jgi:putative ABC transport system permease protein
VAASDLPLRDRNSASYVWREGDLDNRIRYHRHYVGPDYFAELGIGVRLGRGLTRDDTGDSPNVAVISAAMAARVFPGEDPVGRRLYLRPGGEEPSLEIVGVAEDVRYRDLTIDLLAQANSPDVYMALAQFPTTVLEFAVRATTGLASLPASIRDIVAELDPALPVIQMSPLAAQLDVQTAQPRFGAFLLGVFSVVALILACVGIYGVLAFSVGQRAREIAVRRAIGATAGDVARSVIGDGLKLATLGLVIGVGVARFSSRLLEAFLFEVEATDPATLGVVLALLMAVSLIATAVPAYRASNRDPNEVLNGE